MRETIFKLPLLLLAIVNIQFSNAQSYNITAKIKKFEYECFACGKKDVHYLWDWDMNKISSNCPGYNTDKNVQGRVRDVVISECKKLTSENPGITYVDGSMLALFGKPKVEPVGTCARNYNGSKHDINQNSSGVDYELKTTISKEELDKWLKFYKTHQEKEETDKKAKEQFQLKFESKFAELIAAKTAAEKGDTLGIDRYNASLNDIIKLGGGIEKLDFSKVYKNSDNYQWSFRELVADLGMLYLYCGLYERGIKEITYLQENVDPNGERIHLILGMAYLMNCQPTKATVEWQLVKNSSYNPCSIYDKANDLIKEMKEHHPDLKCLKGLRTVPVLASLLCTK
jgi:hypothetical protein